jgi:hypothetical protein
MKTTDHAPEKPSNTLTLPSLRVPIEPALADGAPGNVGGVGDVNRMPEEPRLLRGLSVSQPAVPIPPGDQPSGPLCRLRSLGLGCRTCGSFELKDDEFGIRCKACNRLAWVVRPESITRLDHADWLFYGEEIATIPTCYKCEKLRDTQTVDEQWHCSKCDPNAARRFVKTQQVLSIVMKQRTGD